MTITNLPDEQCDTILEFDKSRIRFLRTAFRMLYPERFGNNPLFPKRSDFQVVKRDQNFGFGVVSYRSFEPGEIVAALAGEIVAEVTQHTLQIRPGAHLLDLEFCGYFLHSCSPNVFLDMERMLVLATRPIRPNDYIFMDYAQTESILFKQFPCRCGSMNCRGWITGYAEAPDENDERYRQFLQSSAASLLNRTT